MIPGRRLTFQLTPLLDLLLIVIFAQYLDVESTTRRETVQWQSSREQTALQLEEALRQILDLKTQMIELQASAQLAETRSLDAERFRVQRDLVGELVAEMFRIPEPVVNQMLKQMTSAGPGPSSDDLARFRRRLHDLSGDSSAQVVEHLLAFGEMRKRIDLWELYLNDAGELILAAGERKFQFRVESTEDVVAKLYDAYKTLPESKSMVLVLFTYGDARFGSLKVTLDALPRALDQIRLDSGTRTRIEYAILGFRPVAPRPQL